MAIVSSLKSGKFLKENVFPALYGANYRETETRARYLALAEKYQKIYGADCGDFFSSSGRIEICGNHTDHNHGKVLVAAIGVDTLAAVDKAEGGVIRVSSEGYPDMVVDTAAVTAPPKQEFGTSLALIKGVVRGYLDRGLKVGGFNAVMNSSVFRGAGVSSSASFELLIAEILNVYYNGGQVSQMEKAQISQFAENEFFGKPCGLLDQAGISLGGVAAIDFANPARPVTEKLTPDFSGYDIVLTNTGGDHSDLTDCYASIRKEMNEVAAFFHQAVLREVPEQEFYAALPRLKGSVSDRAILRAMHFYEENKRIDACLAALKAGRLTDFFAAINASGESSYKLLQNCYVPGETSQPIPLALAVTKRFTASDGAVRVHGGGFAGTILAFIPSRVTQEYLVVMKGLFGEENVFVTEVRASGACRVSG